MNDEYQLTGSGWDARSYASVRRFVAAVAGGSDGASLIERDGVTASVARAAPQRSLFNSVLFERPADLEAAYADLEAAYRDAGIAAWTVWVPAGESEVSAELLRPRGHALDGEPRMMAFDLAELPNAGGELEFSDEAEWGTVCAINDAAYGLPAGSFEAGMGADPDPGFFAYEARHDGWPASVLATLDHDGDCGVYLVATLPEVRGRGYAGRLLHRALCAARDRGCETSTLQASRAGASIYARLGYRDLGGLELWERRRGDS